MVHIIIRENTKRAALAPYAAPVSVQTAIRTASVARSYLVSGFIWLGGLDV